MNICMCDVGDGLNLYIDNNMMVDFGGEEEKLKFYYRHRCCGFTSYIKYIETFILSHFHKDHYNGLFLENIKPRSFYLNNVYYQGIPIIVDENGDNIHTKFFSYLMAINHYMLGDQSGVASADLISRLQQLSRKTFKFSPLFKGDTFTHNTRKYEVLWPPRILKTDDKIVAKIKTAIEDFENAKKVDKKLGELAEKYHEIAEKYACNSEYTDEKKYEYPYESMQKAESQSKEDDKVFYEQLNGENIHKLVKTANSSLRAAANDLSLAFKTTENELLFMGDLETSQINILCEELKGEDFKVFVTPHHGTHSGVKMKQISSKIALSSVGKLYKGYLENKYLKDVSNHLYSTKRDSCLKINVNSSSIDINMYKHNFERIEW